MALAGLHMLAEMFVIAPPRATYFLFPRLKPTCPFGRDDVAFTHALLRRTGVAMVPGSAFGPGGEQHVRLSFAVPPQRLAACFERLVSTLVDGPAVSRSVG